MSNFTMDSMDSQQMSMIANEPADAMAALEEKILRAVEMVKKERALRVAAEVRLAESEARNQDRVPALEEEIVRLRKERDQVRQRVERLLHHLDELNA